MVPVEADRIQDSHLLMPSGEGSAEWIESLAREILPEDVRLIRRPSEEGDVAEDALLISARDGLTLMIRIIGDLQSNIISVDNSSFRNERGVVVRCPFAELLDGRAGVQEWLGRALGKNGADFMVGFCILLPETFRNEVDHGPLAGTGVFSDGPTLFAEDLSSDRLSEGNFWQDMKRIAGPFIGGAQRLTPEDALRFVQDDGPVGVDKGQPVRVGKRPPVDLSSKEALANTTKMILEGLDQEIEAARRRPTRKFDLENGRDISLENSAYHLYAFECSGQIDLLADTPVDLVTRKGRWHGLLVSVEGSTLVLRFEDPVEDSLESPTMVPDPTFILKELAKRLGGLADWLHRTGRSEVKSPPQFQGPTLRLETAAVAPGSGSVTRVSVPPVENEELEFWDKHRPNLALMAALLGSDGHTSGEDREVAAQVAKKLSALGQRSLSPNVAQRHALARAAARIFHVIWGPPGTGKTASLAQVARLLGGEQGKRVLVLAHANVAVDEAMLRVAGAFAGHPLLDEGGVLRVGNIRKDELSKMGSITVDGQLMKKHPGIIGKRDELTRERQELTKALRKARGDTRKKIGRRLEELKEKLDEIKKLIRQKQNELIADTTVLGTTLSQFVVNPVIFSWNAEAVIVDEASMAPYPMVFVSGARSSEKVLIFGDFRQLGPIAVSNSPAAQNWLKRDVFDITGVTAKVDSSGDDARVTLLDTQYRMAQPIAQVVSDFAYSGRLKSDPESARSSLALAAKKPFPDKPLVIVDSSQLRTRCVVTRGKSRVNPVHAGLALQLSCQAIDDNSKGVALITPFREQAALLQIMAKQLRLSEKVTAATVHTFQGAEKDCVILDLTEGFPQDRASLLTGDQPAVRRLLNVAASRAKGKLLVLADLRFVGDIHGQKSFTREFIRYLRCRGCLIHQAQPDWLPELNSENGLFSFVPIAGLRSAVQRLMGTGAESAAVNLPGGFLDQRENGLIAESLRLSAKSFVLVEGDDESASMWERCAGDGLRVEIGSLPIGLVVSVPGRGLIIGAGGKSENDHRAFMVTENPQIADSMHRLVFGRDLDKPRLDVKRSEAVSRLLGECPDCGEQRMLVKDTLGYRWAFACSENLGHTVCEASESDMQDIVGAFGIICPECGSQAVVSNFPDTPCLVICPKRRKGCRGVPFQLEDFFKG